MEPWEKALINGEEFLQTEHGEIACTSCHQGVQDADKDLAHTGLVARPSEDPVSTCGDCHPEEADKQASSLHASQQGYWTVLEARGASSEHPAMQQMFDNHCASCHTTCGDCHVSQPASVGGGLLKGHAFIASAPMSRTCTACHGSRIGNEYMGKHEEWRPDVHFRQGRMTCQSCHTASELHGELTTEPESGPPEHRYDGNEGPRCEKCHDNVADDDIQMHNIHGEALACQVCHSVAYTNCDGCHVAVSESTGNPFFETAAAYLAFLIGRNPIQSEARPYQYALVRHVPVDPDSFSFYGESLMPDFDAQPTWRHTTPHNIQRNTPQTESCNACHGNPDLFLTSEKVAPEELNANRVVIVEVVPELR